MVDFTQVSPECLKATDNSQSFEFKYFVTLVVPLAIFGAALAFFAIYSVIIEPCMKRRRLRAAIGKVTWSNEAEADPSASKKKKRRPESTSLLSQMIGTVLFALKFLYLSLATKALSIFNCTYDSLTGAYYFEVEPNRVCFTKSWWNALLPYTIAALIIYVFGTLTLVAWLERKAEQIAAKPKDKLKTSYHQLILDISKKEFPVYRDGFSYWDVMIMLRKLVSNLLPRCLLSFLCFALTNRHFKLYY